MFIALTSIRILLQCSARSLGLMLLLSLCTSSGHTQNVTEGVKTAAEKPTSLSELLARADSHPMLRMQAAAVEAARHRIAMRSSLMNPMLMLGVDNLPANSFRFDQEMMTSKTIGLSQRFPWPGKLAAEKQIAESDTLAPAFDVRSTRADLRRDIKLGYFELYHFAKEIETDRAHLDAIRKLIEIAEDRLAVNRSTQEEVLSLQLEATEMKSEIANGETMLAIQQIDLAQIAMMENEKVQPASTLGLPQLRGSLSTFDSIAVANNPVLVSLRSQAENTSVALRRNALEKYPDFDLSLMYMQRDALAATSPMNPMNSPVSHLMGMQAVSMAQSDMISARVSIELPVQWGNQREEEASEITAMRTMKEAQFEVKHRELRAMLEGDLEKLRGLKQQYDILIQETYPIASASLETSNANLVYNKADIGQVLRNELNILHKEHAKYQLEAEYNKTIAQIEYIIGVDLINN